MAWGMLSKPGTEYGPCLGACKHRDCQATRDQAATACAYCAEPIGYGARFYAHPMAHADCAEDDARV